MRQSVIHPGPLTLPEESLPQTTPQPASQPLVSPDIINLANNSGLSIETIGREAERINKKVERSSNQEVVIPLR